MGELSSHLPGRNLPLHSVAAVPNAFTAIHTPASSAFADVADRKIPRLRESILRALSDGGQIRVWNLLLDVAVQTGCDPSFARSATKL